MEPTDLELEQFEEQQRTEEQLLQGELERLHGHAAQLEQRAAAAAALADALEALTGTTPVSQRLHAVHAPEIYGEQALASARKAREEALRARREAACRVRQMLAVGQRSLEEASGQIDADEREARRMLELARLQREEAACAEARAAAPKEPPAGATATAAQVPADPTPAATRRASPRVPVHTSVDLTSHDNFYLGFSANISEGGIFVATLNTLPPGTEVELSFRLPTGDLVKATGRVQWLRELSDVQPDLVPGIGVQFTGLDDSSRDAIHAFVQQRDPLFYVD